MTRQSKASKMRAIPSTYVPVKKTPKPGNRAYWRRVMKSFGHPDRV